MPPRRTSSAGRSSSDSSKASQSSGTGSQSSDAGKKQHGPISIPFTLHRGNLDRPTGLGSSYVEMPSRQESIKLNKDNYPMLVLVIKDKDDSQRECLMRMKNLTHENVLGVRFWEEVENEQYIRAHVEPYTESISNIIADADFLVDQLTESVPSPAFQEIVSAIIPALDYIIESGYYHGNLSWETTLYHQNKDKRVVKLANFELKDRCSLVQCQLEDYISLGASLEWASQKVKKEYHAFRSHTCYIIDDLARILKSVTVDSVQTMKLQLKDHEFFWDSNRKKIFFAYDVPQIFKNDTVKNFFWESSSMPSLPWTASWQPGLVPDQLMKQMLIYRGDHGLGSYDPCSVEDFLRFISGMYSHENELRDKIEGLYLDAVVQEMYPRLFFDLKKAIQDAKEDDNAMVVDN